MIKDLYNLAKNCIWAARYRRAVKRAKEMRDLFGMTWFVILMGGKLKVVPKRTLKTLVAQGRFKRGTTIQDLEKRALFIAK